MYIDKVPNRNSRPAYLLREAWRENGKVCKRTIANLTDWASDKIDALRKLLRDEPMVNRHEAFSIERSIPHGHVEAILMMMRQLGLDELISTKRSRQRDLVVAMIAERLIDPCSKLATTRLWHSTTLARELGVEDADENELYAAMDWLAERQPVIEQRLAARHLHEGAQVFYDISSSYYEGSHCELASWGHNRDKKQGKPIIVYGVLTDADGRPVAVEVYPGNTADPTTVPDQVQKLKKQFSLQQVVLVGDRGMLTQTQIEVLQTHPGIGWISALRTEKIRLLLESGVLQLSLFDEQQLAEISSEAFPAERLIACFNPLLADERKYHRQALLEATEQALKKLKAQVERRVNKPLSAAEIGQKLGRIINHYNVAKHFDCDIQDGQFSFKRNEMAIKREADLDGMYVIRTSESKEKLSAEQVVRSYKNLSRVEEVFRTLKSIDLRVRPIYHRDNQRVKAHIFLCLLSCYVQWHLRRALCSLLYEDEQIVSERQDRDPVRPAEASQSAKKKKGTGRNSEGVVVHSFSSLMTEMGTLCRNRCKLKFDQDSPEFEQNTKPTMLQAKVFELIKAFPVRRS